MRPPDAATKTVRLYGETLQRSHGGFVWRSQARAIAFGALDACVQYSAAHALPARFRQNRSASDVSVPSREASSSVPGMAEANSLQASRTT
jgi:hypothetical protein